MQARLNRRRMSDDDPLARAIAPPPDEPPDARDARIAREADAKRVSDDIDENIRLERLALKGKTTFRLLLLGQSESGKSTTLKNLQMTFAPDAWKAERVSWRIVIQLNLIRSINSILDVLAEEMAAAPPMARPPMSSGAGATSPLRTSPLGSLYDARPHSVVDETPTQPRRHSPPLQFTNIHALLKLRLAPLRRVEEDLKTLLGAGSVEVSLPSHSEPMSATPFDAGYVRDARGDEIFVRSHRSWRDALSRPRRHADNSTRSRSNSSGDAVQGAAERKQQDNISEVAEVMAGCKDDMAALWRDDVVRAMLRRRKIRPEEGSGFFLDDIERIASRAYEPSDDDVVRARLRTVGVQEYELEFENLSPGDRLMPKQWLIYDVGGSRTARAAWLPYFEDVNAIIFLAPISCFDEHLLEDRRINRLEDTWILWKSIVRSRLLTNCTIILFLNKYDLLQKKLQSGVVAKKFMPSFGDRENTAPVFAKYMFQKFREQFKDMSPEPRPFYGYLTSVVDTQATASTLASMRDGILRQHLKRMDLIT